MQDDNAPSNLPRLLRPDWDEYFMGIAYAVSRRGTCDRAQVGAVLVQGRDVIATGYNGALGKLTHCDDAGHDMQDGHCVRTVHAEVNALASAARNGISTAGSTLFTTHYPCLNCFKIATTSRVREIVYDKAYRKDGRIESATLVGSPNVVPTVRPTRQDHVDSGRGVLP